MSKTLDELLTTMSTHVCDVPLDRLEPTVMAAIARRDRAGAAAVGWQAAAVVLSLGIGTIVGGASATAARPADAMSVFTPEATLAPSNLLGGGR